MKIEDITIEQCKEAARLFHSGGGLTGDTLAQLMEITGAPRNVCLQKLQSLCNRGLMNYGVSVETAWWDGEDYSGREGKAKTYTLDPGDDDEKQLFGIQNVGDQGLSVEGLDGGLRHLMPGAMLLVTLGEQEKGRSSWTLRFSRSQIIMENGNGE